MNFARWPLPVRIALFAAGMLALAVAAGLLALALLVLPGHGLYAGLAGPAALALALLLAGACFGGRLPRRLRDAGAWLLLACGLGAAGKWGHDAYHARFAVLEERVTADIWRPFGPERLLATLPQPATLRLEEPLPKLDGASALYPLYAAFVQATYPPGGYYPSQPPAANSGTPYAYRQLIEGEVDMVFAAQPSAGQLEAAQRQGVALRLTPIGREAFVFFVHADNRVNGLSRRQIAGIYTGAVTRWDAVGGRHAAIRAFQRPEGSGSQTQLLHILQGRAPMEAPQQDVVQAMRGIVQRAADYKNYPDAIGFSFLYFTRNMVDGAGIKLLAIDGVAPTRRSIADGSYPFTTDIYAVTVEGRETQNVRDLLAWIAGPEGQELVERTGYVALPPRRP